MPRDRTEEQRLMEAASAQAVDAIAIVTADPNFVQSKIVYVNEACCKLLACSAGEAIDLVVIDRGLRWKPNFGFREELEALAPHMPARILEVSPRSRPRPRANEPGTRTEL